MSRSRPTDRAMAGPGNFSAFGMLLSELRVLELIRRLRASHSLAYLLVSHNLAVVQELCERPP
jgi:ABC-type microcin C transport system duplicated ATPase subunit YejF